MVQQGAYDHLPYKIEEYYNVKDYSFFFVVVDETSEKNDDIVKLL